METFNIAEDDYSARIKRCFYLAVWGAFNIAEECVGGIQGAKQWHTSRHESFEHYTIFNENGISLFHFLLCTLVPWKMFTLVYSVYFSARGVVVLLFTLLRHTIVLRHMENVFAHGYELD